MAISAADAATQLAAAKAAYLRALKEPRSYSAGDVTVSHAPINELREEYHRLQRLVDNLALDAAATSAAPMRVGTWRAGVW